MTTPENLPLRAEPSVQVMDLTAGDPLIGMVLSGRYRLEEKLGRGTTGAVYLASHVNFSRKFAIKVLHAARADDAKLVRRFDREAELGGLVSHANVISVIDVGETPDGTRYMVMELATGENLAVLLQDEAPMAAPRVLHLLRELCEGLHHAHERRVIHRDFKPENIIVERDDHGLELPRIVDFGIAIARDEAEEPDSPDRLTTHGLVLGTPHYMAPEQATGFAMDHRIDLFALGVIAFEMLSGVLPFDGSGVEVARANILVPTPRIAERVPGLAVDPLLEAFTRLLMAKDPTARPVGANAARELLDLIERDPLAAAAALGVPADAVVLPPIVAVAPADRAAAPPMAFLPSPTAPFFTRSAPPSVEVLAVPDEGVRLRAAPPRRRWVLALAGVAALAALGVVLWMATRPPRPPLAPVAAPVAMAMTPTPTPIDDRRDRGRGGGGAAGAHAAAAAAGREPGASRRAAADRPGRGRAAGRRARPAAPRTAGPAARGARRSHGKGCRVALRRRRPRAPARRRRA